MRKRECLNGEWFFMTDNISNLEKEKIMVPSSWKWIINDGADFQPYDLFEYPKEWNEVESGIISKKVLINKENDEKVFLIFEGIFQKYIIYINNQKIYESGESFLTTEIDITDYVINISENEIKVWCGPYDTIETETGNKRIVPDGTWYANMARGIWHDVYIEYRPLTYIDDVTILTSTRNMSIDIKANVIKDNSQQMDLIAKVIDDGKVKKEWEFHIDKNSDNIEGGSFVTQELWQDAIYWSPEYPHLYLLQVQLIYEGNIIDIYETTFGFREIWLEGHKFYLNGKRINLRGDAWHYQGFIQQTKEYALNWYKVCKETGINFVRLHGMPYPKLYLDVADEVGMLVIDESAIYGSAKRIQADHPEFIDNCKEHLKKLVKRDKNHPSVIIWSMQNEMRWVDGREGYKKAMKSLSATMKELDNTRPIAYDGDNRLVDPNDMEIVSMHYNIDGTVGEWDKQKPLIFGEHGKWHYVSPQVSTAMMGSDVYLSFDKSIDGVGIEEKHFIEHARREEVTGVSPFNMINYTMHMQPKEDIRVELSHISEAGVQPKVIKAHTTPVSNGYFDQDELFYPNSSWKHLKAAFKPVTIIPNEYNHSFFDGRNIKRSFSIYNDIEKDVEVKVKYKFISDNDEKIISNEYNFDQLAGEKQEWKLILPIPVVKEKTKFTLNLELYHDNNLMDLRSENYKVYPSLNKRNGIDLRDKKIGYFGEKEGYDKVDFIVNQLVKIDKCDSKTLSEVDILIIGNNCKENVMQLQLVLQQFANNGGFLLILEQESFVPGEVTLSGKKFFSAFINDQVHPIFKDIEGEDLFFWGPENMNNADYTPVVANAFNKPVQGDLKILLECGEGDFGWGGLLWTSMVEYSVGTGRVLMSQLNIIKQFDQNPQASLFLKNIIQYGIECVNQKKLNQDKDRDRNQEILTGLVAPKDSDSHKFFKEINICYETLSTGDNIDHFSQVLVDLKELTEKDINILSEYVEQGGKVFLLPVMEVEKHKLQQLLGSTVDLKPAPVYQLKAMDNELTRGLSSFDLYHFEKATYSPADKDNLVICQYAINNEKGVSILESVKNPWYEFFVKGFDEEFMKISIADRVEESDFTPNCYGLVQEVGKGQVVVVQLDLIDNNDKIKRIYSRLLSNFGVKMNTQILTYEKEEKDFGIRSVMALPKEKHQDYDEMEQYFSDKNYLLNNLGEGVFGWMKRVEKKDGIICIPNSANKTYFITLFMQSDINRNPEKRENGQLPDSSIVPDVYMDINCRFKLLVNGKNYFDYNDYKVQSEVEMKMFKIDDVVLEKGTNRMCIICQGGNKDIQFNTYIKNKYGDYMSGLKYLLTLD